MYKLKGCAPTTEDYHGEPYGGQVLSRAEQEILATQELSRVLARQGLPSPYRALGYFKYPLTFRGESLACSIMEARGDTRLDELMYDLERTVLICATGGSKVRFPRYVRELGDVFYKLGQWAGWLKRIMDENNMPWSASSLQGGRTNAHIGNYVVFSDNGKLLLGVVDLDDCHFPFDDQKLREEEYHILIASALDQVITSANTGFELPDDIKPPLDYKYRFVEGLEHGYMNANAVRIHPEEIEEVRKAAVKAREELREEVSRSNRMQEHRINRTHIDSSIYLGDLLKSYKTGRDSDEDIYNNDGILRTYTKDKGIYKNHI